VKRRHYRHRSGTSSTRRIGEAVKQVPAAVRHRHPDVPWKDMAGMRDVLVHDYFGVDAAIVWKTVQEDLPPLKRRIADILAAIER